METIKTAAAPYSCFEDIKRDIAEFAKRGDLNGFQKWAATERYVLEPKLDFEPKSIIAAAAPFKIYNAAFTYGGKRYVGVIEKGAGLDAVKAYLSEGNSYNFFFDYWLPQKRIAARSGLADYGKNNICYVEGMGSLIELFCFISDMPCPDKYVWREARHMPECGDCGLCRKNCPTGAIPRDRFLIDTQRCITNFNEWGDGPFPDFIPKGAHHRTTGCSRCQEVCPKNKGRFDKIAKTVEFDGGETELLLSGEKLESLPAALIDKVKDCDMEWYYGSLPRNLRAMFRG